MSRLQQLIKELCPNGVNFKELGQVLRIRNGKDYKGFAEGHVPVYGSGGVIAHIDQYIYDKTSVLIPRKGSIDKLYYVDVPFWTVDTIFYTEINTEIIEPKFVFYFLQSQRLERLNTAGGIPSLTQAILNKIRVPLPPLQIQQEIVRILDSFTDLIKELNAELDARRKQYESYRDLLLKFDDNVKWVRLGDIAEIGTGSSNTNEELENGKYPFFVRSQEVRYKNDYEFDETAIITSGDGVGVGKVFHYVEGKYALHQRAYRICIIDKRVLPKYFFYYMKNAFLSYIKRNAVYASVTSVRKHMLENFPVPVPSLEEQQRIVDILDRFDTLINDPNIGISAEIELRRKQYEYYRDKLLDFKEVAS
jgi:type I restriction enzyme S subunit